MEHTLCGSCVPCILIFVSMQLRLSLVSYYSLILCEELASLGRDLTCVLELFIGPVVPERES